MQPFLVSFLVITSCCCIVLASNFTDCGSSARNVRSSVLGCDGEDHCPFIIGRNATFLANFTAPEDMNGARLKIFGVMGSVSIPFPVTPREVCNSVYNLRCPMAAETDYNLKIELPIRNFYPRMRLKVQVELQSKSNSTRKIVCSRFPVEIMNPQTPETTSPAPQ